MQKKKYVVGKRWPVANQWREEGEVIELSPLQAQTYLHNGVLKVISNRKTQSKVSEKK